MVSREICGSHGTVYEDDCLLGCDVHSAFWQTGTTILEEYAAFVFVAELKMKAVYSSKALILNY